MEISGNIILVLAALVIGGFIKQTCMRLADTQPARAFGRFMERACGFWVLLISLTLAMLVSTPTFADATSIEKEKPDSAHVQRTAETLAAYFYFPSLYEVKIYGDGAYLAGFNRMVKEAIVISREYPRVVARIKEVLFKMSASASVPMLEAYEQFLYHGFLMERLLQKGEKPKVAAQFVNRLAGLDPDFAAEYAETSRESWFVFVGLLNLKREAEEMEKISRLTGTLSGRVKRDTVGH